MNETTGIPDPDPSLPAIPAELVLDPENYRSEIETFDLTEDQKRELLETLWSIMRLFVELGFSVDVGGRALEQIFDEAARGDEDCGA